MGILNVTPDSFSDGGMYVDRRRAVEHGLALAREGADIVDVGGESTRPGADQVAPQEEISRVSAVISALAADLDVPLSIDTRHAEVAASALSSGASIINDVSGFRDPAMVQLAASTAVGLVVMHMIGDRDAMPGRPVYGDVVADVRAYLAQQTAALEQAGVARNRIVVDPGIGFGKTSEHNLELLRRLPEIASLGYPVLIGVSRKRFIGELTGESVPAHRTTGSIAAALWALQHGADIVRVHDVKQTSDAVRVWDTIEGACGG